MSAWKDIETAPKDGTWVLLAQGEIVRAAPWVDTSEEVQEEVSRKGKQVTYEWVLRRSGYWDCADIYDPDHWMPLPAPPLPGESNARFIAGPVKETK